MITCTECGHRFSQEDWWACPTCEADTPALIAERKKQGTKPTKLGAPGRKLAPRSDGSLRELLF